MTLLPVIRRRWTQWISLTATTGLLFLLLSLARAPAAALLAPLAAGIVHGLGGAAIRPPSVARLAAFSFIGAMAAVPLGAALGPALLGRLPVLAALGAATLALCLALGWGLARLGWFEGGVAVWGLAPGNSATMVALAETQGADPRLVAILQYFRILTVTAAALALAHTTGAQPQEGPRSGIWPDHLDLAGTGHTLLLCLAGMAVARFTRFSAGVFLVPGVGGALLIWAGVLNPQAPQLLALAAYAVVGWGIGLGFTAESLRRCAFALPRVVLSTILLVALCAGGGFAVSLLFRLDLMTALLATAPGGMDTILIIAAASGADLPFVLAAQMARIIIILAAGPPVVAWIARCAGAGR